MALARATAMHAIRCYDRMRDEIEEAIAALSELETPAMAGSVKRQVNTTR